MMIDGKPVDARTLRVANMNMRDYPDFCDAYFCAAKFTDGQELSESQVETLNEQYGSEVNSVIHSRALYV